MPTQSWNAPRDGNPASRVERKLPEVTLLFWALKTVAVTLGETAGDLRHRCPPPSTTARASPSAPTAPRPRPPRHSRSRPRRSGGA